MNCADIDIITASFAPEGGEGECVILITTTVSGHYLAHVKCILCLHKIIFELIWQIAFFFTLCLLHSVKASF